jgi:DNA topoisomerase VI subunit B
MLTAITSLEGFDPLATGNLEHDYSRIIQQSQKRDILNILRSYTGTLDVFSEAVQNAIDAVDAKQRGNKNFIPRIHITIDLQNNLLRFVDNGIGLSLEQVRLFLRPNVSFKENQNYRGHKGVGATFLAYG